VIRLLGTVHVPQLVIGSMVARLPAAMLPLAILLMVETRTGSLAAAGLVVGAFGLGRAIFSPPVGAMIDRIGQARVLVGGASAQALLLVVVVVAVEAAAPLVVVTVLAVAAGGATPPVQASLRALWPKVTSSEAERDTAYAFDATSQEAIWIVGPLLVAAMLGVTTPAATVIACGGLGWAGVVMFVLSPVSRGWRGSRRKGRRLLGALASTDLRKLVVLSVGTGFSWGALTFGLAALAVHAGGSRAAGLLLACVSLGSIAGGLVYGSKTWLSSHLRRLRALLLVNIAVGLPLFFARSVIVAVPLSFLCGVPLAPIYGSSYVLTGRAAPEGTTTEAFTWTSSAYALGISLGAASAGALSQLVDLHAAFGLACLGSAAGWLAARTLTDRRLAAQPDRVLRIARQ
jgi:MFS family permease